MNSGSTLLGLLVLRVLMVHKASRLGKFIDVPGRRFLVDAKSYLDENYGNTADGFSLKKYAKIKVLLKN